MRCERICKGIRRDPRFEPIAVAVENDGADEWKDFDWVSPEDLRLQLIEDFRRLTTFSSRGFKPKPV